MSVRHGRREVGRAPRAVAVDHEPAVGLGEERGVEPFGQRPPERERAGSQPMCRSISPGGSPRSPRARGTARPACSTVTSQREPPARWMIGAGSPGPRSVSEGIAARQIALHSRTSVHNVGPGSKGVFRHGGRADDGLHERFLGPRPGQGVPGDGPRPEGRAGDRLDAHERADHLLRHHRRLALRRARRPCPQARSGDAGERRPSRRREAPLPPRRHLGTRRAAVGVLHAEPPEIGARPLQRRLGPRASRDLRARVHGPRRQRHARIHACGLRRTPALRRGAVRRARRRGDRARQLPARIRAGPDGDHAAPCPGAPRRRRGGHRARGDTGGRRRDGAARDLLAALRVRHRGERRPHSPEPLGRRPPGDA